MAPYIMAQSAVLEPSGPPHLNDGYPQDQTQELTSILRRFVMEHDGNTNPSHRAVLFLMELRADLDNRHFFVDVRHESKVVTQAMHLSKEFLQTITDLDGAFALTVKPCFDLGRCIRQIAETCGRLQWSRQDKEAAYVPVKRLHHL